MSKIKEGNVFKFGGETLADLEGWKRSIGIVNTLQPRVVVVSAPGRAHSNDTKVTDRLIRCSELVGRGKSPARQFGYVRKRFLKLEEELGTPLQLADQMQDLFTALIGGLATKATIDCCGELFSAKLFSAVTGYKLIDAGNCVHLFGDGSIDNARTNKAIRSYEKRYGFCVIPGFYGALPNGSIKTLGRNTSDLTGALAARAIGAEKYVIWKEVPGILTAPPSIIPNAGVISEITTSESRELALSGTQVVHGHTSFPLQRAGITIQVRGTRDLSNPGTKILPSRISPPEESVLGISSQPDFMSVLLSRPGLNDEARVLERMGKVFGDHQVSVEYPPSGRDKLSVLLTKQSLNGHYSSIRRSLRSAFGKGTVVGRRDKIGVITLVGQNMANRHGVLAKACHIISESKINIITASQSAHELSIVIGVAESDLDRSVRALHAAFFS